MKHLLLLLAFSLASTTAIFAQQYALDQLENSPRHHEWVEIEVNGRTVHSFVAYPERSENSLAVIVIHENRGLNDWARSFADQVAEAGYLAIAPDLLSGFDQEHERTSDFPSEDAARDALYQLDPDQITRDLHAVRDYIASVPASTGNVVVAGFCWGGSQTFRYATNSDEIEAALVFYGDGPTDADAIARISAPVYGFYGENDQRINATIPESESLMEEAGNLYDYVIYDGAGHGFMRSGDDPDGSETNRQARDDAWERLKELLEGLDGP
ncbi:MAG: dienelactone hydrolase family protein [Balneolaceae bacterium]